MIEEIIAILLTPLTTLLANSALLTAMGGVSSIGLYSTDLPQTTDTTPIPNVYVRLYDSGVVTPLGDNGIFLGRNYLEWQELMIEYVSYGDTAQALNQRINELRAAVEGQIETTLAAQPTIKITSPTGNGSYIQAGRYQIVPAGQVPNSGPNKDPNTPQWKRPRYSKLRFLVFHKI